MEKKTWATMPLNVIEKIIAFTVQTKKQSSKLKTNEFAKNVQQCALVCNQWLDAVLDSRDIFESNPAHFISIGGPNFVEMTNNGLLCVVKGLKLAKSAEDSDFE